MRTIQDRILGHLMQHPEGIDDDQLAIVLGLKQRQQANSRCHKLEHEGVVERRKVEGKFRNFLVKSGIVNRTPVKCERDKEEKWNWEGNVQYSVIEYLKTNGYSITRFSNTKSHEKGKDIEAYSRSGTLWVTVKGYPKGTTQTHPSTQAGHWFKQALFDVVSWRGEDPKATIAVALPDYERYRNLVGKISWLQPVVRFSILWVKNDNSVTKEN